MAESSFTQRPPVSPAPRPAGRRAPAGQARVEAHPAGRVLAHGQQPGVTPDVLRAGLDLLAGHGLHELGVVVDLQRAEALGAGVLGDQPEGRPAVATHEAAGGTRGSGHRQKSRPGRIRSGQGHTTTSSSSPHRAVEPCGTELAPPACEIRRTAVAGASSGRVPLPLWMSGTPGTVPSPPRASPRQDVAVSTRIVYTDLDGTMVGPRGSFWHTEPGSDRRPGHRLLACTAPASVGAGQRPDLRAGDRGRADLRRRRRDRRARRHRRLGRRPRHPPAARRDARGFREPDADGGHGRARHRRRAARRAPRAAGVAPPGTARTTPTPCSAAASTRSPSTRGCGAGAGWLTLKDNGAPVTSRMTLDADRCRRGSSTSCRAGSRRAPRSPGTSNAAASPPPTPSRSATASATWRWHRRSTGSGSPRTGPPSTG